MTCASTRAVGAHNAVATAYFSAQRVGNAMCGSTGITRDHMAAMSQILAHTFSVAALRLGKRAQGNQNGKGGQQLFHGYSSLVGVARPNAGATVASQGRRISCPMAWKA
jgi:hypothetical protein